MVQRALKPFNKKGDKPMKKFLSLVLAMVLCLTLCGSALAADFPTKEITYLCGYGAGGSSDIQARLMQPYAEKYFGVPMVIENLGGAGGCTALTDYNTRAADGYTISSFNTTPLLKNVLGQTDFDYFEAFDFLGCVITTPIVVVVTADSPYSTIEELIAYAQANPEDLLYASAGAGSITHLAAEMWQSKAGLKFTHVPFNGGTEAMTGLLNKSVDFEVASLSEVLLKHEEGSLRILASCTNTTILSTAGEDLNIPVLENCDVKVIQGVCVQKAVDEEIKVKLAEGLQGICTDAGYIADMKAAGYDLDYMDRESFTTYLTESAAAFKTIVEETGLLEEIGG